MTVRRKGKISLRAAQPIANSGKLAGENPMRRAILKRCAMLLVPSSAWAARSRAATADIVRGTKWTAFYGQNADERMLSSYGTVVLDPMFQGSIAAVATAGARACAYLSLGEIRTSDTFFNRLSRAALLEENPAWPGTHRIDVRHPSWKNLILGGIIPFIAAKGFTGLLLDTLDTPPYLEQLDPSGKRGMRQAAIDLVHAIRRSFPNMLVIVNRGYALLPSVIDSVDGIVVESLLTTVDQSRGGGYKWNEPSEVALQLSLLSPALQRRTPLPILSLDYWDPEDVATMRKIYLLQRHLGHHPYVATRALDRVIPEPPL